MQRKRRGHTTTTLPPYHHNNPPSSRSALGGLIARSSHHLHLSLLVSHTLPRSTPPASIIMEEVHSAPAVAKRMWGYLRAVFFMARKGLLSHKRRLLVTMRLLSKRRAGINKAVAALLHNSQYSHGTALRHRDYEFSCTNSPASSSGRRRLAYFPSCLGAVADGDYYAASPAPPPQTLARIEHCYYYAAHDSSPAPSSPGDEEGCGASPDLLSAAAGRFSVRVSNYSSEDEGAGGEAVDHDAEEFIRRFYDQLRRQNAVAMLPYTHEAAA
ncbi:hypothetical protein BS78_03G392100 [Paspalum vaginatum]|nr:hypothetical protein BS78_03G392100 [Paspalum vaginatum]